MRQNKNSLCYMGGSGLDWTDDFLKFCRSGLDRIQFCWIRTGLGLKNFKVRSSLIAYSYSSVAILAVFSVATARIFSLDLGFFFFIWGSGVFIKNLGFFDSGQILQMYVVLLCFPFKNTVVSQA